MLSIQRGDTALAFELSSYEYTVRSVTDTLLEGNIGYIRVTDFFENTPDQFRSTLSAVVDKGVSGIILDLRDNAGGSREAAEEIISYLMPLGMYGTVTDYKGVQTKLSASANSQLNVPAVVLINDGTAGEAEFAAGVLQEFSLATLVGQTSAGKAKYQQYFTLETDHSAIKLTVGEYGLLKGGSWQGKGITPTLEVALSDDQQAKKQLLEPAEDGQVQAAVSQLTAPTPPVVTVTTTAAEATADTTTTTAAVQ
jgi:carboxyl-terminal processing protease